MEILTANKAKTHFGEMLMKAQREPVQIQKNGKPIAVVVSIEDYEAAENIKLQMLKDRFEQVDKDIKNGFFDDDADEFFEKLLTGGFDE